VFASIGPTGKLVSAEEITAGEALAAFEAQVQALAAEGPDALLCETFSDVEEARLAARAARASGLPVIVSFAFDSGKRRDRTMTGATPEVAAKAMAEEGVQVVGANCGAGPEAFAEVCRRLGEASGLPVWIKPNAGMPVVENGRIRYTMTPEAFAGYLPALIEAGACFVGGCCGTSPPFIAALARSRKA
jgi:methionine synthase I (cobalamin-dependent)